MSAPRSVREDVHVHAPADEVYALLIEASARWWPPAVTEVEASGEGLAFTLDLPGRRERATLMRVTDDPPRYIEFVADGMASPVRALRWVVNIEGPREVHMIAELEYEPAGGPLGWLMEETAQRPSRTQMLRDALWRLKLIAEGQGE